MQIRKKYLRSRNTAFLGFSKKMYLRSREILSPFMYNIALTILKNTEGWQNNQFYDEPSPNSPGATMLLSTYNTGTGTCYVQSNIALIQLQIKIILFHLDQEPCYQVKKYWVDDIRRLMLSFRLQEQERTSPKRESSSSLYDRVRSKLSRSISSYSNSNNSSNNTNSSSSNSRSQFTSPLLHLAEADQNAGFVQEAGCGCRNNPGKLVKFSRRCYNENVIYICFVLRT